MLELSHKQLSYNPTTKIFSGDISELPSLHDRVLLKGKEASVVYHYTHVERNAENEVVAWHFWPCAVSEGAIPACRGTKLVVFND